MDSHRGLGRPASGCSIVLKLVKAPIKGSSLHGGNYGAPIPKFQFALGPLRVRTRSVLADHLCCRLSVRPAFLAHSLNAPPLRWEGRCNAIVALSIPSRRPAPARTHQLSTHANFHASAA